jgi:hypothetical protein
MCLQPRGLGFKHKHKPSIALLKTWHLVMSGKLPSWPDTNPHAINSFSVFQRPPLRNACQILLP